ncbi:MAG: AhpC/TSA family protein [Chloroflexi bacterium]|nr:AhpC/TSA family protein [Chloroflexota bacterium]
MPDSPSALPVIGQPAPPIALPALQGQTVSLEQYRGKQTLIVWFSRGFACPFCRQHMARLQLGYSQFQARGAEILQITPSPLERARVYFAGHHLVFPYLCDSTLRVYKEYGLADRGFPQAFALDLLSVTRGVLTESRAQIRASAGDLLGRDFVDRAIYHSTVAYEQGVFIVDKQGIIRYVSVQGPVGDIPGNEALLRELEKIGD